MRKKRNRLLFVMLLLLFLGSAQTVYGAVNVPSSKAAVSVRSDTIGWKKIGKYWYYYSATGRLQSGQIKDRGKVYYCLPNGRMVTGWFQNSRSKKWYYFDSSGAMVRNGWQLIKGKWYYFNKSGVMQKGWQKHKSIWYYLGSDGAMYVGWHTIGGKKYYFHAQGGMAVSQWIRYKSAWY